MEKPVVQKLAAHLFENLPVPFGIAQDTWIERCEQAIGEFMAATPASTGEANGELAGFLSLKIWDNWHGPLCERPVNHQACVKDLKTWLDEFSASSVPQAKREEQK